MSILLVRYSEIGLKSAPVRRRFENQLKDNMLSMLMEDGVEAFITKSGARYYVEASDIAAAVFSLRRVFGVGSISVAEECASSNTPVLGSRPARASPSRPAGRAPRGTRAWTSAGRLAPRYSWPTRTRA